MRSLLKLTNSTRVKRRELLTSFNFAAFYLPYILSGARRVLYLDSDVIVRGDVGELASLPGARLLICASARGALLLLTRAESRASPFAPPLEDYSLQVLNSRELCRRRAWTCRANPRPRWRTARSASAATSTSRWRPVWWERV